MIFQGMGADFQMISIANTLNIWSIMQATKIKNFRNNYELLIPGMNNMWLVFQFRSLGAEAGASHQKAQVMPVGKFYRFFSLCLCSCVHVFKADSVIAAINDYKCSPAKLSELGCRSFRYVICSFTGGMRAQVIDSKCGILTRCETCLPSGSEL